MNSHFWHLLSSPIPPPPLPQNSIFILTLCNNLSRKRGVGVFLRDYGTRIRCKTKHISNFEQILKGHPELRSYHKRFNCDKGGYKRFNCDKGGWLHTNCTTYHLQTMKYPESTDLAPVPSRAAFDMVDQPQASKLNVIVFIFLSDLLCDEAEPLGWKHGVASDTQGSKTAAQGLERHNEQLVPLLCE